MKVIILAPTPPPVGGIASWTVRMLNVSLKNGWEIQVVDEKLIGGREVFGDNSRKRIFIEAKRCINIWKNLWKALNDNNAKIVHSCIPAGTFSMIREYVCAIITKIKRKKFIIHYRCTIQNICNNKFSILVFKLLTNISDLVIVLNKQSVNFVKKHSKSRVVLIPNFIEKTAIINGNSKVISKQAKRILYVGGVIKTKGCFDIISVAKEFPNMQFRLVGNPSSEILNLSIPNNVTLCGEMTKDEVKIEYCNADIFMFVTYFSGEGFSNSLLEPMAHGIPCIATDWAANKDMLENRGGIIVKVRDIKAMANAINILKDDANLRQEQSLWNVDKVKNYYIDSVITDMYVEQYEKLIKIS